MISELRLIYIIMCGNSDVYVIMDDCRLRELQIRLLTGRSKSRQCGGRGTSLESTSSSRLQPRQRREVDAAGLAPRTSILMSDTHASCSQSLLVESFLILQEPPLHCYHHPSLSLSTRAESKLMWCSVSQLF